MKRQYAWLDPRSISISLITKLLEGIHTVAMTLIVMMLEMVVIDLPKIRSKSQSTVQSMSPESSFYTYLSCGIWKWKLNWKLEIGNWKGSSSIYVQRAF